MGDQRINIRLIFETDAAKIEEVFDEIVDMLKEHKQWECLDLGLFFIEYQEKRRPIKGMD